MRFALGFQTGATNTYSSAGDGIPDWWKLKYGLNPTGPASVNGPTRRPRRRRPQQPPGISLRHEPARARRARRCSRKAKAANGAMNLTFPTTTNRVYTVLYANSLGDRFQPLASGIIGTGGSVTVTDDGTVTGSAPSATRQRFYRLQAQPCPEVSILDQIPSFESESLGATAQLARCSCPTSFAAPAAPSPKLIARARRQQRSRQATPSTCPDMHRDLGGTHMRNPEFEFGTNTARSRSTTATSTRAAATRATRPAARSTTRPPARRRGPVPPSVSTARTATTNTGTRASTRRRFGADDVIQYYLRSTYSDHADDLLYGGDNITPDRPPRKPRPPPRRTRSATARRSSSTTTTASSAART